MTFLTSYGFEGSLGTIESSSGTSRSTGSVLGRRGGSSVLFEGKYESSSRRTAIAARSSWAVR
jgi:hypothetical protein